MDTKIRKIFVLLYPLNDFSKRMYEYIQGKLAELAPAYAVVETGGVGYLLHISLQTYSEIEGRSEVKLFTHFVVREVRAALFSASRRRPSANCSASSSAYRSLDLFAEFSRPIRRANCKASSPPKTPSCSKKKIIIEQKIIVELSGKLTALFDGDAGPLPVAGNGDAVYDEATAALVMLGFPKAASDKVVRAILKEQPDISVEETVRMSLKRL